MDEESDARAELGNGPSTKPRKTEVAVDEQRSMLGINSLSPRSQFPSLFVAAQDPSYHLLQRHLSPQLARTQNFRIRRNPRTRFLGFAGNANNNGGEEGNLRKNSEGKNTGSNGGGGDGDLKNDRRPIFNLKLGDLLDPDPDNVVAVGLTCVLTWASVQVLWQLFFISLAILVAALKYSFIAALLIFILIALL